jgi:hypothetical protein
MQTIGCKALSQKFKWVEYALLPDDRADEFYTSAQLIPFQSFSILFQPSNFEGKNGVRHQGTIVFLYCVNIFSVMQAKKVKREFCFFL